MLIPAAANGILLPLPVGVQVVTVLVTVDVRRRAGDAVLPALIDDSSEEVKPVECATCAAPTVFEDRHTIIFLGVPSLSAARHLSRLPGTWEIQVEVNGNADPQAFEILRTLAIKNVTGIQFRGGPVDDWVISLSQPHTAFPLLQRMILSGTGFTDRGLAALARPDTGLVRLSSLMLAMTSIGDKGISAISRRNTGLKGLAELNIADTKMTDDGIHELASPDTGLVNLQSLEVGGSVTFVGRIEGSR